MSTDANDDGGAGGEELVATYSSDQINHLPTVPDEAPKPRKPGTFDSSRAKQARARVGGGAKGKDQRKQSKLEKLAWKVIERALENPDTPEYVLRQYAELALKYERGAPVSMKELGTLPPADASPAATEGVLDALRRLEWSYDPSSGGMAYEPPSPPAVAPQPLQDASAADAPPMPADAPPAAPGAAQDAPAPRRSGRSARSAPPVPTTAPARSLSELTWRPLPGSGGGDPDPTGGGGRCC